MDHRKIGDMVRIKDLPVDEYPCSDMKKHAGKVGRITDFYGGRAVLCIHTGFVWWPFLLEKVKY